MTLKSKLFAKSPLSWLPTLSSHYAWAPWRDGGASELATLLLVSVDSFQMAASVSASTP